MTTIVCGLLAALLLTAPAPPPTATDTARAVHLLRRATFGIRADDLDQVLRTGTDAWLDRQLRPDRIADDALARRLAPFAALDRSIAELHAAFPPPDLLLREVAGRYGVDPAELRREEARARLPRAALREIGQRSPRRLTEDLVTARLIRSVHSERQLEAVMTDFWFDHFNVHAGRQLTRLMVADYERTAIRPHVFGRFEDMLLATARHPAMLYYLDNWTSVAPDRAARDRDETRAGRLRRLSGLTDAEKERLVRQGRITREQLQRLEDAGPVLEQAAARMRERGINENYAREVMELHTLGVDGGYTEDDVVAVARALTGWTFVPLRTPRALRGPLAGREPGTFFFNAAGHDRGAKTILGRDYPAGGGEEEGEAVLVALARSPQTARFVSAKLIERFVSDEPDPAFVGELADVWQRTGGDLREVTRALFSSPRFFDPAVHGAKMKTPFELVASALRVTGAEAGRSRGLMETLRSLGNLPYDASAPTGYPAMSEDWVNSGAMLARMNFALDFAAGRIDGVSPAVSASSDVDDLLRTVLPGSSAPGLTDILRDDPARALGLALGSPEFQQR